VIYSEFVLFLRRRFSGGFPYQTSGAYPFSPHLFLPRLICSIFILFSALYTGVVIRGAQNVLGFFTPPHRLCIAYGRFPIGLFFFVYPSRPPYLFAVRCWLFPPFHCSRDFHAGLFYPNASQSPFSVNSLHSVRFVFRTPRPSMTSQAFLDRFQPAVSRFPVLYLDGSDAGINTPVQYLKLQVYRPGLFFGVPMLILSWLWFLSPLQVVIGILGMLASSLFHFLPTL